MVSPELLRRYPFFAFMTHQQRQEVAMIADEVEVPANTILLAIEEKAEALYLLMHGSIDLHYVVLDENLPALRDLCEQDHDLAYGLQKQPARTTMDRLHATRVLLAAATAPV